MKSGLAAAMIVTARAKELGLPGDVILTAVSDEEHASIGTSSVVERWTADAAIVVEPTGLELSIAHKGFTWLEVVTHGVAAHGSLPHVGVDAIAKMGPVLVGLESLDASLRDGPKHPLLGTGSIHASLISGGQELSSYPEACRLDIERRTVPGEDSAAIERQVQAVLDDAARNDSDFKAELTMGLVRNPYEIATDAPIVALLRRHASLALDEEPNVSGGFGWMDSAILGTAGIPTVIFGPDGAGAHAAEEWVDLGSVESCTGILMSVVEEFCG